MPEDRQDVQRLSPDKLVTIFSKSHIALCLIVAIGLHVAILAATSTGYIRDTWIDPAGAQQRQMAAEEARKQAKADERARRDAQRRPATNPAAGRPAKGGDDVPENARNKPIYRATTQKAAPHEIPKEPSLTDPMD